VPAGHTEYTDWWKAYGEVSNPTSCAVPQTLKAAAPGAAAAPCVAPQVANPAGLCADVARPAVNYYNAKSDLAEADIARPSDATWSLWNATLALTEATATENAAATVAGESRSKAGQIAYWTGSKKSTLFAKE